MSVNLQEKYGEIDPLFKKIGCDSSNAKALLTFARYCETTERYVDMVTAMKRLVVVRRTADEKVDLGVEERNMLSVGYKNLVGKVRVAWRHLSQESPPKDAGEVALLEGFKVHVEEEARTICNE